MSAPDPLVPSSGDDPKVVTSTVTAALPELVTSLATLTDKDLIRLRAGLDVEMKRRNLAVSVGQIAEQLAIDFFNGTAGRPNLQAARTGTANVDALSRRGDRYSIKGILNARKTGTIYPDRVDPDKQLFEYLLIVKLDAEWQLEAIYEIDWKTFCDCRSWDARMNAWYVGVAARTLAKARRYTPTASRPQGGAGSGGATASACD
jgi:hypothetical protein